MVRPIYLKILLLAVTVAEEFGNEGNPALVDYRTRPALEILMHVPPPFKNVNSFLSYLQGVGGAADGRADPESSDGGRRELEGGELWAKRRKREVPDTKKGESQLVPEEGDVLVGPGKLEPPPVQSALRDDFPNPIAVPIMDIPEGIMRSLYAPFETDGSKDALPVNDDEDRVQRDKRTFMDGSGGERETTTAVPYWKRKKESPPFVTGRDGGGQKMSNYQPAQHRSVDNARESHSMKDLDKTVLSNEITRNNQDNYFASTNRRTYNSRQAENYTPRTPKSVYDTIDYTNRRRNQEGRGGFGRNFDSKRQTLEKTVGSSEQFARQYTYPRPYDRPYYPFQGDVIGRGTEYYHRTFDPSSGRIIYYANMPDPSRHYDPNFTYDPTGRSIYINGRTYLYDPYGRSYIYPNDYRFPNVYGRTADYLRNGRSSVDFYYQGGDKGQRNSRFNGIGDRSKDDFRNRTYVIFDAEESATQDRRTQQFLPPDFNRFGYPIPPPYGLQFPPPAVPPVIYPNYSYRNQYYPTVPPPLPWGTSQKPYVGGTTPGYVTRPLNVPEVQLPLSTRNRSLYPLGDYDKMKKT